MIDKIHNESCLDTMARMPDNFIDLTVTSPPYDNLRTYNGAIKGWGEDVWKDVLRELYRVTKKGGVVVWVVGDATIKGSETGTSFKQALFAKEVGFRLHDTMIYMKSSYTPLTHNRYEQQFEYMFVFSKSKPNVVNHLRTECNTIGSYRNRGRGKEAGEASRKRDERTKVNATKIKGNVWIYPVGLNDRTPHPAPFPEQLANDHIISWSNEGDLVYDPFMGSGTTAKMAILNNRHWIGSEISEEYCEIARKRLKNVGKQIRIKEETHNAE